MRGPSAVATLAFLASCAPQSASLQPGVAEELLGESLVRSIQLGENPVMLVHLDEEGLPRLPGVDASPRQRREAVALRSAALIARVDKIVGALPGEVEVVHRYDHFPLLALSIDSTMGADWLLNRPEVLSIERDPVEQSFDAASLDLIQQPTAFASGFDGSGTAVAVLDTGADYTHPDLGSCTSVGSPASCRVVYEQDFANDDGELDANGHGTNVAAIVSSVAPGADILSLDVFTGGSGFGSDILAALDWVVTNEPTYNVAAVNMSLGSGSYTSACTNSYTSAINAVRAAGVSVVIASGNDAYTNAVASPACNANAVTVGAVWDATRSSGIGFSSCSDLTPTIDNVTCFSNSSSLVDVLAPGALVTAGGRTMAGTSQATPHVAGAMAVLRAANPDASLVDLEQLLFDTGDLVTDHRNGLVFPRVNLTSATAGSEPPEPDPDAEPEPEPDPVLAGSIQLGGGAPATRSSMTTLSITSTAATQVCLSNTATCTKWINVVDERNWRLGSGEGLRTVRAWFRDAQLNEVGPVRDVIYVDRSRPTTGTLSGVVGPGQATLSWEGFEDSVTSITSYQLMQAQSNRAPGNCTSGTVAWSGTDTSVLVQGLTDGLSYGFSVCAVDAAGNVSRPAKVVLVPIPETLAPVGAVTIEEGAAYTSKRRVLLGLSATDDSMVTSMCLSNTSTCTRWKNLEDAKSWVLPAGDGEQTVYASYRDEWGNASEPFTASIVVDTTSPTDGTVVATPGSGDVTLSWSGFSDAASGVVSYDVYQSRNSIPPRMCRGVPAWSGSALEATFSGLENGRDYGWRLCATDGAGNVSSGVTATGAPAAEHVAPTGSIVVEEGADWVDSTSVSIALDATDASGVTHMCLSTTDVCTRWTRYRATTTLNLPKTSNEHTVTAWFRDSWGNVSEPATDLVQVDLTRPDDGAVSSEASDGVVSISWADFEDVDSGVAAYHVMVAEGDEAPSSCRRNPVWSGMATTFDLPNPTNGTTYAYRVCAEDAAGNLSRGETGSARPAPEYDAPVGSILVNGGDPWTNLRDVTVSATATDLSGVTAVCLSTRETCTRWVDFADTLAFRLSSRTGEQTVYATFRDAYGNESEAFTTTIGYDASRPTNGVVLGTFDGLESVDLTWANFDDEGSGIVEYWVFAQPSTLPADCDGVPDLVTPETSTTWSVTSGVDWGFRVCAVDALGQVSSGGRRLVSAP